MSNRTVAIIASVMAAVSFVADATVVRLSYTGEHMSTSAKFDLREVSLSSDGVHVRVGTSAGALDLHISVHTPTL